MKIVDNKEIVKNKSGEYWYKLFDAEWRQADDLTKSYVKEIYDVYRGSSEEEKKERTLVFCENIIKGIVNGDLEVDSLVDIDHVESVIGKFINFFSEFHYKPAFRFINTFSLISKNSVEDAKSYVVNYFELTDSPYTGSIVDKRESSEFETISQEIQRFPTKKIVNRRLEIWYGDPGTGKTTKAMEVANNSCMVCHNGVLPQDLMEDFEFIDGSPNFKPSLLQNAMVEGKTIVLDEMNLLPFESLRFLQSVLDGKESFEYKGRTITISENFKVIGTMNLDVNGCTYSLPQPLVDRASRLVKFELTPSDLVGALI